MAKSFEENKLNNFKAHYTVVKQQITEVTAELKDISEKREEEQKELDRLGDEVKAKREELLGLHRNIDEANRQLKETTKAAQDKEAASNALIEVNNKQLTDIKANIRSGESKLETLKSDLIVEEENTSIKLQSLAVDIQKATEELDEVRIKVKAELKQLTKLIERKELYLIDLADIKKQQKETLADIKKRLAEIEKQELKTVKRIKEVLKREERVKQQESGLEVIKKRVAAKYKELYPNRAMII